MEWWLCVHRNTPVCVCVFVCVCVCVGGSEQNDQYIRAGTALCVHHFHDETVQNIYIWNGVGFACLCNNN